MVKMSWNFSWRKNTLKHLDTPWHILPHLARPYQTLPALVRPYLNLPALARPCQTMADLALPILARHCQLNIWLDMKTFQKWVFMQLLIHRIYWEVFFHVSWCWKYPHPLMKNYHKRHLIWHMPILDQRLPTSWYFCQKVSWFVQKTSKLSSIYKTYKKKSFTCLITLFIRRGCSI